MTLREWRKDNRFSLPALAKLYREKFNTSMTHQTLSNYERGFTKPSREVCKAILQITKGKVKPDSFVKAEF